MNPLTVFFRTPLAFACLLLMLLLSLFTTTPLLAQPSLTKSWDKTFGGNSDDYLMAMAQGADGGYLLGGYTNSVVSGDKSEAKGLLDMWVVKTNSEGTKLWDKTIGGTENDLLYALLPTQDGGFLLGGMSRSAAGGDKTEDSRGGYDFWVVKLQADGTKAWDKRYGGGGWDQLNKMIATPDGGYLLGGYSESDTGGDKSESARGERDYWVVKINADGGKMWDKTLGGMLIDDLSSLLVAPDGGYLVGGHSNSPAIMGSDKSEPSKGMADYWIVKLNADGTKSWDKTVGGTGIDYLTTMLPVAGGGYLLGGMSSSAAGANKTEGSKGGQDHWLVQLNENGTVAWDKTIGGNGSEDLYTMVRLSDGGILLGGASSSGIGADKTEASRGSSDFWLVKLNATGSKVWDKTFGGNSLDQLRAIVANTDGSLLFGGWSLSEAGNDKTETSRGGADYWMLKLTAQALSSGSPDKDSPDFMVYPNPSRHNLHISLPGLQQKAPLELTLLNLMGQPVYRHEVTAGALQTGVELPATAFPSGAYYLRLTLPGRTLTRKVILIRE